MIYPYWEIQQVQMNNNEKSERITEKKRRDQVIGEANKLKKIKRLCWKKKSSIAFLYLRSLIVL